MSIQGIDVHRATGMELVAVVCAIVASGCHYYPGYTVYRSGGSGEPLEFELRRPSFGPPLRTTRILFRSDKFEPVWDLLAEGEPVPRDDLIFRWGVVPEGFQQVFPLDVPPPPLSTVPRSALLVYDEDSRNVGGVPLESRGNTVEVAKTLDRRPWADPWR